MESISNLSEKIKLWAINNHQAIFTTILVVTIGLLGYGLGRLSKIEEYQVPVRFISGQNEPNLASQTASVNLIDQSSKPAQNAQKEGITASNEAQLVGSKNGTKYHYLWCSGALRIKDENKVFFANKEEAEQAGYTPAANCPGL